MKYKLIIITENKPGGLYRIADLFLRRRINIESLSVRETDSEAHLSRFAIEVECDGDIAIKISHQVARIVEVKSIEVSKSEPHYAV